MPEAATTTHDYAELRSKLTTAVRRSCPGWLSDQVEDLVQASLVRIVRRYPDTDLNTSFLFKVAHSVVIDEIRRRRRREELSATPSSPERVSAPATTSPERRARSGQIGRAIVGCLATLSTDRRRAVTLYLQGHKVPEASVILGFSRKKTENLVYRGLADLREELTRRGVEP